jgi:hypothetical protein
MNTTQMTSLYGQDKRTLVQYLSLSIMLLCAENDMRLLTEINFVVKLSLMHISGIYS